MALSTLAEISETEYQNLPKTPFQETPGETIIGQPDTNVVVQLGFWVGDDVLAFKVTDAPKSVSGLSINIAQVNTLNLILSSDTDPKTEDTYWTVDMGRGARVTDWQISFQVDAHNTDTGTWVFTKGKGDDN